MTRHIEDLQQRLEAADLGTSGEYSRQERIDIVKIAMREVMKEWLDERVKDIGRWSMRGIALAAFAALVYFILTHSGWRHGT